jgi:hypothetical protein
MRVVVKITSYNNYNPSDDNDNFSAQVLPIREEVGPLR